MVSRSLVSPRKAIKDVIDKALKEDAAGSDRTVRLLPQSLRITGAVIAKQDLILAGGEAALLFGKGMKVKLKARDGARVAAGGIIAEVSGPARTMLSSERSVLNLIARLSGIATRTRAFVDRIAAGSKVGILDTRKTTPGLRLLEKYAVRCGGGLNHRMSLAETIFVKDNHIAAWEPRLLFAAIRKSRGREEIIIEADCLAGAEAALDAGADRILLDNMPLPKLRDAIRLIRHRGGKKVAIEVSGGVTLEDVAAISRLDIDFISVGALTHSAPAADVSLEVLKNGKTPGA